MSLNSVSGLIVKGVITIFDLYVSFGLCRAQILREALGRTASTQVVITAQKLWLSNLQNKWYSSLLWGRSLPKGNLKSFVRRKHAEVSQWWTDSNKQLQLSTSMTKMHSAFSSHECSPLAIIQLMGSEIKLSRFLPGQQG